MKGEKMTRLKHVPNVLVTSASQNYISGDYAVNKALTNSSRVLRLLSLGRFLDSYSLQQLCRNAAFALWKSLCKRAVLGQIDEVLAKLHPFESGNTPRGAARGADLSPTQSEESIIVAAFSPVSRHESENILRMLDIKLTNIAKLLENWRQREVTACVSVGTQTAWGDSLTESKADFLRTDTLVLQEPEAKLEDRKLESLLAIDESYEAEHSLGARFAAIPDVTESEFLVNLPESDPALMVHKLKLLEKKLVDRETRLIQITKTTHQELQLLVKEREQIAKERAVYSDLEAIRAQLRLDAEQLEARSRNLDEMAVELDQQLAAQRSRTPSSVDLVDQFQNAKGEQKSGSLVTAMAKWMQVVLLSKAHTQRNSKLLSFGVWKAVTKVKCKGVKEECEMTGGSDVLCAERIWERTQSELELSGRRPLRWLPKNKRDLELELMESKRKREFITVTLLLLKAVSRSTKRRIKARLVQYWYQYRVNAMRKTIARHQRIPTFQVNYEPAQRLIAVVRSIFDGNKSVKTGFYRWKNYSSTYENKLLRAQLSLFDMNLQGLELQEKGYRAEMVIAQSQLESKLAQLSTLLEHYLM